MFLCVRWVVGKFLTRWVFPLRRRVWYGCFCLLCIWRWRCCFTDIPSWVVQKIDKEQAKTLKSLSMIPGESRAKAIFVATTRSSKQQLQSSLRRAGFVCWFHPCKSDLDRLLLFLNKTNDTESSLENVQIFWKSVPRCQSLRLNVHHKLFRQEKDEKTKSEPFHKVYCGASPQSQFRLPWCNLISCNMSETSSKCYPAPKPDHPIQGVCCPSAQSQKNHTKPRQLAANSWTGPTTHTQKKTVFNPGVRAGL